jgi:hypothetical protein
MPVSVKRRLKAGAQPGLAAPHCGKPQTENGASGEVFWLMSKPPKYLEETP